MEIPGVEQQHSRNRAPELQEAAIPALRPRLPGADRLLPYLRRIDATRVYSNWGPLAGEFGTRLSERFRLPSGAVAPASSGTSALVGAVLAHAGRATRHRPNAIIPALTFTATGLAVEQCGYRVHLVDVDRESWMLDPDQVAARADLERVGLVVPVAAFGKALQQERWRAFSAATGIPVVIDAAASFEAVSTQPEQLLGPLPVALSFHATKSFATGEGGCVACGDAGLARLSAQALNFGFWERRGTTMPSTNGKMSEYAAAVGLAELDGWAEKASEVGDAIAAYESAFAAAGLGDRLVVAPTVASSYVLFAADTTGEAERVQDELLARRVGYRLWYGSGMRSHTYWKKASHDSDLRAAESLATRLMGLPMAPDLSRTDVEAVAAAVAAGVAGA